MVDAAHEVIPPTKTQVKVQLYLPKPGTLLAEFAPYVHSSAAYPLANMDGKGGLGFIKTSKGHRYVLAEMRAFSADQLRNLIVKYCEVSRRYDPSPIDLSTDGVFMFLIDQFDMGELIEKNAPPIRVQPTKKIQLPDFRTNRGFGRRELN